MPLFRLIAIALAIWIIWFFIRKSVLQAKNRIKQSKNSRIPAKADDRIVKCDACGLHIPQTTALEKAGRFYCSVEHGNL